MNQYLLKINSLFSKTKSKNFLYVKKFISPKNDWVKIIFCFFVIFIFIFIFSVYFYFQISGGDFFGEYKSENTSKSVVINQKLLTEIIEDINFRKDSRENLIREIPLDPSI
jgi:hypothetical protein